ncbi:hypothetical protein [Halostagnicola bangensis]
MCSSLVQKPALGLLQEVELFSDSIGCSIQEDFNYITIDSGISQNSPIEDRVKSLTEYVQRESTYLRGRMKITVSYDSRRDYLLLIGEGIDISDYFETFYEILREDGVTFGEDLLANKIEECRLMIRGPDERTHDGIAKLVTILSQSEDCEVDISLQISKETIATESLANTELNGTSTEDYSPQFWTSLDTLEECIRQNGMSRYLEEFKAKQQPVLFLKDLPENHPSPELLSVFTIENPGELTQGELERYRSKTETMGEFSAFGEGTRAIPPAAFTSTSEHGALTIPFVYALFSLLSDRIESVPEEANTFDFVVKGSSATISGPVDVGEICTDIEAVDDLKEFYDAISIHEDQETFIDLWQRSLTHHCDSFGELPAQVDDIVDHYRTFEEELVDSKLQDLSNAIRDVHTFMNDLVNQVTTASANLSNELQRLTLTVAIALLANFFLIASQNSLDIVLGLSYALVGLLILAYLPIVEERVDELNTLRRYTREDFDAYRSIVREYAGEALNISDLDDRREEYNKHVYRRVCDAQRRLRRTLAILVFVGLLISAYTTYIITTTDSSVPEASHLYLFISQVGLFGLYFMLTYRSQSQERLYYTFDPPQFEETTDIEDVEQDRESEADVVSMYNRLNNKNNANFPLSLTPTQLLLVASILAMILSATSAGSLLELI